jgi:hypothetical protein
MVEAMKPRLLRTDDMAPLTPTRRRPVVDSVGRNRAEMTEDDVLKFEQLARLANPTGGTHTPTPWKATPADCIVSMDGALIASFVRPADRDLALYFANVHPGMISLIRTMGNGFAFIANTTADDATRRFAREHADMAQSYADLFCRLGKPIEGGGEDGGAG